MFKDNYKIYSLIIILNTKIVASVRCGLFKMSNVSHPTMLLPNPQLNQDGWNEKFMDEVHILGLI